MRYTTTAHLELVSFAAGLYRLGGRPTGPFTAVNDIPITRYAGCFPAETVDHDADTTSVDIRRTVRRMPAATLVTPCNGPTESTRIWSEHRVSGLRAYRALPSVTGGRR